MAAGLDPGRPVRWGILGAGGIAATVGAQIAGSPESVVATVGARDAGRAQQLADRLGAARAVGSYAELVADPDVDVVYVATTHAQHHEHALLALRAGKPVLVEKAFTLNARQAREVIDVAQDAQLFCMEAMWMRFNPLIRRAQALTADGAIGDIVTVQAELSARFPYDPNHRLFDLAAGGGALLDLGIYPAQLVWAFLGRPNSVLATGELSPTGSDLSCAQLWTYPGGTYGQLWCTTRSRSPRSAFVQGTDGWLSVDTRIHRPTGITVSRNDEVETLTAPDSPSGYALQVTEVERALRAGETESRIMPLADTIGILESLDDARAQIGVRYPADEG